MRKHILWITRTAAMLALLICLQWVGSFVPNQLAKQLLTGTMVNCVLAVTALYVGYSSGITIALISPVFAFLLHIAPNLITVLPIMAGNCCYVVLMRLICGKTDKPFWRQGAAVAGAATVKFGVLYLLVVKVICGLAAPKFLGKKLGETILLAPPMLKPDKLPLMFAWPQLVTAICGGILALCITPFLRKALHRQ